MSENQSNLEVLRSLAFIGIDAIREALDDEYPVAETYREDHGLNLLYAWTPMGKREFTAGQAMCACGHERDYHEDGEDGGGPCGYASCSCMEFECPSCGHAGFVRNGPHEPRECELCMSMPAVPAEAQMCGCDHEREHHYDLHEGGGGDGMGGCSFIVNNEDGSICDCIGFDAGSECIWCLGSGQDTKREVECSHCSGVGLRFGMGDSDG